MSRYLRILIGLLVLGAASAQAAYPLYGERPGKYPVYSVWDSRLPSIYDGWKKRFVTDGKVGGNTPGSTSISYISEGQSYGMLLSLWFGDQAMFNTIWSRTEASFWQSGSSWYAWNITTFDANFAGDADIDICGALIFASALVDSGKWTDYTVGGNNYKAKAKIVLQTIMSKFIDKGSNYRINSWPGAGDGIRNPSYHMPAWYPIFKEFAKENGITTFSDADWTKAADGAFDLLNAQPNGSKGFARNFSSGTGGSPGGGTSSPNNYEMGFDAIRVPYRVGMAAMWYPKELPRAVAYAKSVWNNTMVDPSQPGMYYESGKIYGWEDFKYEHLLSRAMWGTLAASIKDSTDKADAAYTQILRDFSSSVPASATYLVGTEHDTTISTSPHKNYYAQSLGLLGALAMSGRAFNVWDDMKHKWVPPDTAAKITTALKCTPASISIVPTGAAVDTPSNVTKITATLSRSIPWSLKIIQGTASMDTSGTSTSINFKWHTNRRNRGAPAFVAGTAQVRLVFNGVDSVSNTNSKSSVTLTPSTGVQKRPVRGVGNAGWVNGGIRLQDNFWQDGDQVRVQIRDMNGRTMGSSLTSSFRQDASGLVLDLPTTHSMSVRILEVTNAGSLESRQYLISPNP